MPTRQQQFRHKFEGGWVTDIGTNANSVPDRSSEVKIPFLVDAENCLYELDGAPRKIPGTSKLNSSVLESGAVIKGLFDYWISGTGGTATQHRVIHINTKVMKDDGDGSFSDIGSGLTADSIPGYSVLEDVLILTNENDIPKSWDGTTFTESSAWAAGAPPKLGFVETHKNRMWGAGAVALPSRLYYSALLDAEDWVGAGSGSIDIDPNDGDVITGVVSHRNELWIFKGPYKGSIHRITGSAPTGDDAFARIEHVAGIGAVGQNSIFRYANDLGFLWSDGSIRSLQATERFGDYLAAALSAPINLEFLFKRGNLAKFKQASASYDDIRNTVYITLPIDGSATNNVVLACDFRFSTPRWSFIPALQVGFIASVIDTTDVNKRITMLGGNDGFIRKWNQTTRAIDDAAIAYKITTPSFDYGQPFMLKTLAAASVGVNSINSTNLNFLWNSDENTQQQVMLSQGGAGAPLGSFQLDVDKLSGNSHIDKFVSLETGGQGRRFQYQVTHNANSADIEIRGINTLMEFDDISLEN